jgi:hypothetical protein
LEPGRRGGVLLRVAAPHATLATVDGLVDTLTTNLGTVDTVVDALATTIGVAGAGLTALASAANLADIHTDVGTAIAAIKVAVKKNTALAKFAFLMTDSTNHAPATGKTVTCTRSVDGAAFGAGTLVNVAEVGAGMYTVDFGAGDLNGDVIVLQATAAASDVTFVTLVTAK